MKDADNIKKKVLEWGILHQINEGIRAANKSVGYDAAQPIYKLISMQPEAKP